MSEESPEPTEQEILASVFYHCDVEQKGLVTVSQILDFLRRTKPDWDFRELEALLDPNGIDPEVDLEAYQAGISLWVQSVRSKTIEEDEADGFAPATDELKSSAQAALNAGSVEDSYDGGSKSSSHARSSFMSAVGSGSILEADSSELSRSFDLPDAIAALQESQLRIKHLVAENEHLQRTVSTSEEQNTALLNEVDELRKRITKQNDLLSRHRKKMEDQLEISNSEDQRRLQATSDRVSQLEKEKAQLEMSLTRSEDERVQLAVQLERVQDEYHTSVGALSLTPSSLQQQLHASTERTSQLESRIAELSSANVALQTANHQLESMLSDFRDQQAQTSYGSPLIHSTPVRRESSLHDELMASEKKTEQPLPFSGMPSPSSVGDLGSLNGLNDGHTSDITGSATEKVGSFGASAGSVTRSVGAGSTDDLMALLSNVRHNFQLKKTQALRQLVEISDSESASEDLFSERIDSSVSNFSNFERKLVKLVSSRKMAVERAAELEKDLAFTEKSMERLKKVTDEEIEILKKAKESAEYQAQSSEKQVLEAHASLEEMQNERNALALELEQCSEKLEVTEDQLKERTTQYEELLARKHEPGQAIDDPPTSNTPPVPPCESENHAISALLKGLPSEYNLLRSDPGVVEKHYRNISEILQDLCESAEGCPETTRRAKEDAEIRLDWCAKQLDSLATPPSPQHTAALSKSTSSQLASQLRCAVQQARIAGRSEQDFLYLSLIKVLVQYINLIRLEVFLPSMQRSKGIRVHEAHGRFSVTMPQQSMPRSAPHRWQAHQAAYNDGEQSREELVKERADLASRSGSRVSPNSAITTVFHESCLSYQHFGDIFPPLPPNTETSTSPPDISTEDCGKIMGIIEQRQRSVSMSSSGRSLVLRSCFHFIVLLILLVLVTFTFQILSQSSMGHVRNHYSDALWHVLPQLGGFRLATHDHDPIT